MSSAPDRYRLTGSQFQGLASGYGDEQSIEVLRSVELSRRLLLLRSVAEAAAGTPPWRAGNLDTAWELLEDTTASHPRIGRWVLSHPFVDAWATRWGRLFRTGQSTVEDLGYVAGLAAAAAIRAGVPFELPVPTRGGEVAVPTLGLAYGLGAGPATIRATGTEVVIAGGAGTVVVPAPYTVDSERWCARRELTADSPAGPLTITVEDLDPYRTCFGQPVAPRLAPVEFHRMGRLFRDAWQLIGTHHPSHARAMRVGLGAIVPLRSPATGSISAAARTAFGSISASLPEDGAGLALLMIHEAQHVKLGALLNFVRLYRSGGQPVHHAPWRADPRPVGALLQGTYAHLGVTDYWRMRRHLDPEPRAATARFEYAYWLEQTRRATGTLARSGELTAAGERFVDHLGTTLDDWARESAGSGLADGVTDLVNAVSVHWRLANFRTPEPEVTRLATRWRTGRSCPPLGDAALSAEPTRGPARTVGLAEGIRTHWNEPGSAQDAGQPAQSAYLSGDFQTALAGYADTAAAYPEDDAPWAGLALAATKAGVGTARILAERPDLVRALVAELRRDPGTGAREPATPQRVAAWLSGAVTSAAAPGRS